MTNRNTSPTTLKIFGSVLSSALSSARGLTSSGCTRLSRLSRSPLLRSRVWGLCLLLLLASACTSLNSAVPGPSCKLQLYRPAPTAVSSDGAGIKAAFVTLPNEGERETSLGGSEALLEFQMAADASSEVDPTGLPDAQLLNRYGEALRRDMEATARSTGIQLSGPYKRRSDLVYGQKEALDFIFVSGDIPKSFEITVDDAALSGIWKLHADQLISTVILPIFFPGKTAALESLDALKIRGRIQLPNTVDLLVVEPLSGEKLMAEPLSLQPEFVSFESSFAVLGKKLPNGTILLPKGSVDLMKHDPELARLRCELLNKQYQANGDKIGRLLEPRLLKGLLGQSKALKGKVVYPANVGLAGH